ncbi:hypothetical protein Golomagni_08103, partial [Golovinomyces magnicellulatus]
LSALSESEAVRQELVCWKQQLVEAAGGPCLALSVAAAAAVAAAATDSLDGAFSSAGALSHEMPPGKPEFRATTSWNFNFRIGRSFRLALPGKELALNMVLYVIGLGLADENDITLKGFEAVKSSERIYLESYTSILMVPGFKERLEKLYQKQVILAHRETVELEAESILEGAATSNIAFLVVGDPLSATTHTDLILRAKHSSPPIPVKIIHNASIMTAIGSSGLAGYNFGQTVSVPFWSDDWKPDSWLERIGENLNIGLHTLALSDIKVREQSAEDMSRGILRYQDPRYMLIPQLISQILSAANSQKADYLDPNRTLAIALCRMGSEQERI